MPFIEPSLSQSGPSQSADAAAHVAALCKAAKVVTRQRATADTAGLDAIADLPDPVGCELARLDGRTRLDTHRVALPIGVIAMVSDPRPNAGAAANAPCITDRFAPARSSFSDPAPLPNGT